MKYYPDSYIFIIGYQRIKLILSPALFFCYIFSTTVTFLGSFDLNANDDYFQTNRREFSVRS